MFGTVSAERNDAAVDAEADGEGRRDRWCIGASFRIRISMHSIPILLILPRSSSNRAVKFIGALVSTRRAAASAESVQKIGRNLIEIWIIFHLIKKI